MPKGLGLAAGLLTEKQIYTRGTEFTAITEDLYDARGQQCWNSKEPAKSWSHDRTYPRMGVKTMKLGEKPSSSLDETGVGNISVLFPLILNEMSLFCILL